MPSRLSEELKQINQVLGAVTERHVPAPPQFKQFEKIVYACAVAPGSRANIRQEATYNYDPEMGASTAVEFPDGSWLTVAWNTIDGESDVFLRADAPSSGSDPRKGQAYMQAKAEAKRLRVKLPKEELDTSGRYKQLYWQD